MGRSGQPQAQGPLREGGPSPLVVKPPLVALVVGKDFDYPDGVLVALAPDRIGCTHGPVDFVSEEVTEVLVGGMLGPKAPWHVVSRVDTLLQRVQHAFNLLSSFARRLGGQPFQTFPV